MWAHHIPSPSRAKPCSLSVLTSIFFIPRNKRKLIIDIIENNNLKKRQITYFMNYLLKKKINIKILKYTGHWYEIDDYDDLKEYNKLLINE